MTPHTITLEQQGVPADIANHRRSIHAAATCAGKIASSARSMKTGYWGTKIKRCNQTAVSLVEGRSFCAEHRVAA